MTCRPYNPHQTRLAALEIGHALEDFARTELDQLENLHIALDGLEEAGLQPAALAKLRGLYSDEPALRREYDKLHHALLAVEKAQGHHGQVQARRFLHGVKKEADILTRMALHVYDQADIPTLAQGGEETRETQWQGRGYFLRTLNSSIGTIADQAAALRATYDRLEPVIDPKAARRHGR